MSEDSTPISSPAEPTALPSTAEVGGNEEPRAEPIPAVPDPIPVSNEEPFIFHGNAREYFRIWIVNTLLTLLTLGVYSAWAKVRKRRYLRGNIELMKHRFEYLADPHRILAGNVLVAVLFLLCMVIGEVYPVIKFGALLVGLILLPWVIVRSLAFNAHNTAYRGMRFHSRQTYGAAALLFIGQFLFILVSLGLYYPAWVRNRKEFVISGHQLGDGYFRFESKSGPFYRAYLVSGLVLFAIAMAGSVWTISIVESNGGHPPTIQELIPFYVLYGAGLFFSKQYVYARLFNHIWNHTQLDEHRFKASLSTWDWLRLQTVNLGAIIISGGLLYPWAVVRSTRYALGHLHFIPAGPIEKIYRLGRRDGSAVGETAAEFVGLDIGL